MFVTITGFFVWWERVHYSNVNVNRALISVVYIVCKPFLDREQAKVAEDAKMFFGQSFDGGIHWSKKRCIVRILTFAFGVFGVENVSLSKILNFVVSLIVFYVTKFILYINNYSIQSSSSLFIQKQGSTIILDSRSLFHLNSGSATICFLLLFLFFSLYLIEICVCCLVDFELDYHYHNRHHHNPR